MCVSRRRQLAGLLEASDSPRATPPPNAQDKQAKEAAAAAAAAAAPAPEPAVAAEPPVEPGTVEGGDGGSGAGSKAPDGGVDQDLWNVLLELRVDDPHAVSDALADNSVKKQKQIDP